MKNETAVVYIPEENLSVSFEITDDKPFNKCFKCRSFRDGCSGPNLFAMGIERLLMVLEAQGIEIPTPEPCDIYIASIGEEASVFALKLATDLRHEGFYAECDTVGRSVKAQMKYADKISARFSMVLGDDELNKNKATVKNMETGESSEVTLDDALIKFLYDDQLQRMTEALSFGEM